MSQITCRYCAAAGVLGETVTHPAGRHGPVIEFYACEACGAQAALQFAPQGGLSADDASWVEREVAARGAFFPADYRAGSGPNRR